MLKNILKSTILSLLLLTSSFAWSAVVEKDGYIIVDSRPSRVIDLPKPTIVKSDLSSVDDAFSLMEVTVPYKSKINGNIQTGVNTNDSEVKRLTSLLKGKIFKGIALKDIAIHAQNYGISDPRLTKLYAEALKQGLREFHLTVDLNRCIKEEVKQKKKKTWELKAEDFTDSPMSKLILTLLDSGMTLAQPGKDAKYAIYSIPLEPSNAPDGTDVITDIMHLKDNQYVAFKDKDIVGLYSSHRTYNLTESNRENRGWIDADPLATKYRLDHAIDIENTLKEGKEIWEIPSRPPLKIVYQDGTSQEIAYTDGKFNPNDRWRDLGKRIARGEIKMDKFWGAHFAPTDKDMIEIFSGHFGKDDQGNWKKLEPGILDVNATPEILLITEGKFSGTHGWGIPAYFAGYDVKRPRQPVIWGMANKNIKNVNYYIFQGPNDSGHHEAGPDGAPFGRILHDKLTMMDVNDKLEGSEKVEPLSVIYNDSLNASNHFANLEVQIQITTKRNSWISKAVAESLEQMVKVYTKKGWIVPGLVGVFRDSIARFINHAARELPIKVTEQIMDLVKNKKYDEAAKIVFELAKTKTEYDDKPDLKVIQAKLNQLVTFAKWNLQNGTGRALTIQQVQSLAMALTFKGDDLAWNLKAALGRILWIDKSGNKVPNLDDAIKKAWKVLNVPVDFPVIKKKTEDVVKTLHPQVELQEVADQNPSRARDISYRNCSLALEAMSTPAK